MAGKRQHFIPQFLQSGFASHSNGDEEFTWVYRKGAEPFNTNIKNTGVEGKFYSASDGIDVDGVLTGMEERFSELVTSLRSRSLNLNKNKKSISDLLAHLETRTRHIRQNFLNASSLLFDELKRFCEDETAFNRYVRNRIVRDPSFLKEQIVREFRERNIPMSQLPAVIQATKPLVKQNLPKVLPEIRQGALLILEHVIPQLDQMSKRGHIQALSKSIAPKRRSKIYSKFDYQIVEFKPDVLPLGDSVVVFHIEGEHPFRSIFQKGEKLQGIYLPISSNTFLAGTKGSAKLPRLDLPTAIAQCSLEFFISSERSDLAHSLHPQIGKAADILSIEEIESVLDDLWKG